MDTINRVVGVYAGGNTCGKFSLHVRRLAGAHAMGTKGVALRYPLLTRTGGQGNYETFVVAALCSHLSTAILL